MLIKPSSDEWLSGIDHLLWIGHARQSWSEKDVEHLLWKLPHFCIAHRTLYHMGVVVLCNMLSQPRIGFKCCRGFTTMQGNSACNSHLKSY